MVVRRGPSEVVEQREDIELRDAENEEDATRSLARSRLHQQQHHHHRRARHHHYGGERRP
ncbi:hypothetical protein F2Q70_00039619 [Brassica cretica]|uniref:Uncharacterized protein n=1 Tax=Brassica cretica TaxID=69181 RepID=A0A8S9K6X2_BRACR|nr:hypothetical protein F2Q70_00039619 [Brassica cretica]